MASNREVARSFGNSRLAAAAALYLASVVWSTWHVCTHPEWNLDGLFYSALALPSSGDSVSVHNEIYSRLEQEVPQPQAKALTDGSGYREHLHERPSAFVAQLPFYSSKPLYVWTVRALIACEVGALRAPYVASALAFLALALVLPWFARRAGATAPAALAFSAVAIASPPFRELGALATPDAASTVLFTLGAAISLSSIAAVIPLSLGVLARPDVAILAWGVLVARWMADPTWRSAFVATLMAGAIGAAAVLVVSATDAYGWSVIMQHTFLSLKNHGHEVPTLNIQEYLRCLGKGLKGHMTNGLPYTAPFLALAVLGARRAWRRREQGTERRRLALLGALWLASSARFLAFPLLADRFFAPAYVASVALGAACLCPRIADAERWAFGTPHSWRS